MRKAAARKALARLKELVLGGGLGDEFNASQLGALGDPVFPENMLFTLLEDMEKVGGIKCVGASNSGRRKTYAVIFTEYEKMPPALKEVCEREDKWRMVVANLEHLDVGDTYGLDVIGLAIADVASVGSIDDRHRGIVIEKLVAAKVLRPIGDSTFAVTPAFSQRVVAEEDVNNEDDSVHGSADNSNGDGLDEVVAEEEPMVAVASPQIDRPKARYGLIQNSLDILFSIFIKVNSREFRVSDVPKWDQLGRKERDSISNMLVAAKMVKKVSRGVYQFDVRAIPLEWAQVLEGVANVKAVAAVVAEAHIVPPADDPVVVEPPVVPVATMATELQDDSPLEVDTALLVATMPIYKEHFDGLPYEAQWEVLQALEVLIEHNKR